jgi:Concanavalin A-like lectin/glucanases superfamily
MVLRLALLAVLFAGCSESLFDQHPGGGGGDDDGSGSGSGSGMELSSCPAPCLADGGGDFGMTGKNWRYLEDTRNRAWTPMTMSGTGLVGTQDPMNKIDSCANNSSDPACAALPDALLVSSSGSASVADPAIEWTSTSNQIVAIELAALVPSSGSPQTIRLYRNSREDSLVTVVASPGTRADGSIVLDALAGDRFLVAVAPQAAGTADIGLQFFASQGAGTFPQQCQLALELNSETGTTLANSCGSPFTSYNDPDGGDDGTPQPIGFGSAAFAQQGSAAVFTADSNGDGPYIVGADVIDRSADTTTQFWLLQKALVPTYTSWPLTDEDLDKPGGLGFGVIAGGTGLQLIAETCTDATNLAFADATGSYPNDQAWHFVRAVHSNGMLTLCVDGQQTASTPVPAGGLQSNFPPYSGQNVMWTPLGSYFNGSIDDVRSFKTALPCGM